MRSSILAQKSHNEYNETMSIKDTISELATHFSGDIIVPGDALYETSRITYIVKDMKPAVIAVAKTNEDINSAIAFAKQNNVKVSVRSGGHSSAGLSMNNDGMVIDLSAMNTIEIMDEKSGLVKLGSGAKWGDVATKLGQHGLVLSSGDTKSVAVGGLTLGGGIGWMLRKYGYAIDSLVGAEVVLADGSVVHASESENNDLFWALRGGGGNFGIVTNFEFQAHKQSKVVESIIMYGVDNLQQTIAGWRNHMRSAPEELTSFMTLMPGFPGFVPGAMIMSVYAGDDEHAANAAVEPLRHLGTVVSEDSSVKDYADVLQEAHPPEGVKFVVKSMYVKQFNDELTAELANICCKPTSPIVQLRMMNGAIDKVTADATAMAHRGNEIFMFAGFPIPPGADEAAALKPWDKLSEYSTGSYSNFISTNTDRDVASVYPAQTYDRLVHVKTKYDPDNFFNHNLNIKPLV
jgi:FAD/FMN-containing dehydrogenase